MSSRSRQDPGLAFLYSTPKPQQKQPATAFVPRASLPVPDSSDIIVDNTASAAQAPAWEDALSNVNAALAECDTLLNIVSDAVYVDEDIFDHVMDVSKMQQRLSRSEDDVKQLQRKLNAALEGVAAKSREVVELQSRCAAMSDHTRSLEQDLETFTQQVLPSHRAEFVAKEARIKELEAVVDVLSHNSSRS